MAAVPADDELMVMTLPEVPAHEKVPLMVCVIDEVKVTVFGGLMVKLLKVLEPLMVMAPVPEAAIFKL